MNTYDKPHLTIRPRFPPRYNPGSYFFGTLSRDEQLQALQVRRRSQAYMRRVEADIQALPEYARRMLVMSGIVFVTAGHFRNFSLSIRPTYRSGGAAGAYHRHL